MPLVRKLINVGNSRAVTIPPDWLKFYEDKTGVKLTEVLMELNGEITIYIQPKQGIGDHPHNGASDGQT